MSLPYLAGLVSGSPRSSTIGFEGWLHKIIALLSSFLAGPSTGRTPVGTLRPQTSFWTLPYIALAIVTHGSERRGRRANDCRTSSRIVELCWFWMAWTNGKIRMVHYKDGYVNLPSKRSCVSWRPSMRGFAWLLRGCRSLILPIPRCAAIILPLQELAVQRIKRAKLYKSSDVTSP